MKFRKIWSEDTQQFHFYWSKGDEQMSPTFTDKETACYWLVQYEAIEKSETEKTWLDSPANLP
jgi:hypothetical protein|tara:strand:- start:42 stop:230 length:189 start_codon:yes stop_codon:yes gene_type:complete